MTRWLVCLGVLLAQPASPQQPTEIPKGEVIKGEFDKSRVYPGTWREYRVYMPRQIDRAKPAPLMVFQDGLQYNAPAGPGLDELWVTAGDEVFKRKTKVKGVLSWKPPIKPPPPRL